MPLITLTRPAVCRQCGAKLQPGDSARYYGKSYIYGVDCHTEADGGKTDRHSAEVKQDAKTRSESH